MHLIARYTHINTENIDVNANRQHLEARAVWFSDFQTM